MSLTELQEQRGRLVTQAREALDEIKANTDESRAAELEERHDKIMADFDKVERQIEREERQAEIEARLAERAAEDRARQRPGLRDRDDEGARRPENDPLSYRSVFHKFITVGGDPSLLEPEERGILREGVQKKAEFRAQLTTSGQAGGYTVPTELANEIIKSMAAWGPMYDDDVATVMNTSGGNPIDLPTVDDTTVEAEPHTEGSDLTDDGGKDVTFGQKTLNAYVFDTEFVKFSMELAQDSIFNMETLLGSLLGERLGRISNKQLTIGTGTNAPHGIVTASTLGITAAAQAAIASDELIDLVHSVNPAYRTAPKVRWQFNDQTLKAVRKLKDGEGNYLWQMGDITKGEPGALLGYRYSINQAMADIAAGAKPIIFGDHGKYFVRKVGSPVIGVMRERFWPNLGVAGLIRFDGELGDTAAVKHLILASA
ncbi:phage major capsid protein [Pelagibacterium sp. H642]|uniref:phage major capsid protein n=1 Tax=Pelagibacterium sp. H642 TaxID=1881069 RepID=UPI0028162754|nr:phage major capsid protein [Pelagibacterium sp. H642]WMT90991.1 phage major capsid protein [Pelagibacterium sp. H642]